MKRPSNPNNWCSPIDEAGVWAIIEAGTKNSGCRREEAVPEIERILLSVPDEDLVRFKGILDLFLARAYTWDLWGAAYLMDGGCSDDGFEYWRCWLILQGRSVYEAALTRPDSLATADVDERGLEPGDSHWAEELLHVGVDLYESRTGNDLYKVVGMMDQPPNPVGTRWADVEELARRFPALHAKYFAPLED